MGKIKIKGVYFYQILERLFLSFQKLYYQFFFIFFKNIQIDFLTDG